MPEGLPMEHPRIPSRDPMMPASLIPVVLVMRQPKGTATGYPTVRLMAAMR